MRKLTIILIFLILSSILYLYQYNSSDNNEFSVYNTEIHHDVSLISIKHMGKVEISKYEFNDIVTYKINRDYLPDAVATLSVNMNAVIGIDLSNITDKDIKIKNDTLYIKLPKPEISNVYINHSKSHVVDTEYGFFDTKELIDTAYMSSENDIPLIISRNHVLDSISIDSPGYKHLQKFIERVCSKPVKLYL